MSLGPSFFTLLLIGVCLLGHFKSTVSRPEGATADARSQAVECRAFYSAENENLDQYSIECASDPAIPFICDARKCHMGGKNGNPIDNSLGHELYFTNCLLYHEHQGQTDSQKLYTIYPDSFKANESSRTLIVHGRAPGFLDEKQAFFKCAWNNPDDVNARTPWCGGCRPKHHKD